MPGPGSHSPVGASSAKRGLMCALSVALADGIEDEESDQAALGTAVHALIERCFATNTDGWQYVGGPVNGTVEPFTVTKEMANGAQVMLDAVRKAHPDRNQGNFWVERKFHCPTIHPLFFGTSDVVYLDETDVGQWTGKSCPTCRGDGVTDDARREETRCAACAGTGDEHKALIHRTLHIWDYKNGHLLVEHVKNEQGMSYACGVLEDLGLWDKVDEVVIHVVQPHASHPAGTVRKWSTTADYLAAWLEDVRLPNIVRSVALLNREVEPTEADIVSGEHCRFCPARTHACPRLMADMEELEMLLKLGPAEALTNEQLGRRLSLTENAKIVAKADSLTAFKRINGGGRVPDWKLVKATGHRVFKDDMPTPVGPCTVGDAARLEFGDAAMTKPELKSPAQIDELPAGNQFTAKWAYSPDKGLRLVPADNAKAEVSADTKGLFTDVTKKPLALAAPSTVPPLPEADRPLPKRRKPAMVAA